MRRLAIAAGLLLAVAVARRARAGNFDTIPMGDLAAIAAGAVVAAGDDVGSVAYNPAGLVRIDRDNVSVSGSFFRLRLFQIPAYLQTQTSAGTVQAPASRTAFDTVPPAVIFARKASARWAYALSLTVPEAEAVDTERRNDLTAADGLRLREGLRIVSTSDLYRVGATLAWAPLPDVRVGVTFNAGLLRTSSLAAFQLSLVDAGGTRTFVSSQAVLRGTAGTLGGIVGVQWSLTPRFATGLTVEPPMLGVLGSVSADSADFFSRAQAGQPAVVAEIPSATTARAAGETFGLAVVRWGVAYTPARAWLSAQVDYRPPSVGALLDAGRSATNVRAGGVYELSPAIRVGAGAFTDFARGRADPAFNFDFVGATAGLMRRRALSLRDAPSPLVLGTTVAVRYSYGWGQATVLRADTTAPNLMEIVSTTTTSGSVHEASFYIGAGVNY